MRETKWLNSYRFYPPIHRTAGAMGLPVTVLLVIGLAGGSVDAAQNVAEKDKPAERVALVFDVPLPITDAVEKSVSRRIERVMRRHDDDKAAAGRRPVLVFEFKA